MARPMLVVTLPSTKMQLLLLLALVCFEPAQRRAFQVVQGLKMCLAPRSTSWQLEVQAVTERPVQLVLEDWLPEEQKNRGYTRCAAHRTAQLSAEEQGAHQQHWEVLRRLELEVASHQHQKGRSKKEKQESAKKAPEDEEGDLSCTSW